MTADRFGHEQVSPAGSLRQIPVEDAIAGLLSTIRDVSLGATRRVRLALAETPGRAVLASILQHDGVRALSLWSLRRLAERGVMSAQRSLGYRLAGGDGGAAAMAEAFQWLRLAARRGDTAAQYALGVMYANGYGVPQCKLQSSMWYQKAAEQGHAAAQFNLGLIYATGDGLHTDLVKGRYWYERSAAQDYPRALFNLAVLHEDAAGGEADAGRAQALYLRAAELGFAVAHLRLAELSLERPPRLVDACFWFTLAALGLPEGEERMRAAHGRDCCHSSMHLADIEKVRQRVREWRGG